MQAIPTTLQAINKILQNSNGTQSLHTRQQPLDEHLILVHCNNSFENEKKSKNLLAYLHPVIETKFII